MIIEQAAQQLPPMNIKMLLKLGMREPGGVRPIKEADQRLKPLPARGKRRTASRPSGERRSPPRPRLHLRCQPARQAGLHRPRRKVRHNGCRDRRSRWPPPWSTLDMSNADFDTRHTSPRPAHQPPEPPANGPKHRSERARTAQPRAIAHLAAPQDRHPSGQVTAPKPRIYREFTVSSARPPGPLRRAAPDQAARRPRDCCIAGPDRQSQPCCLVWLLAFRSGRVGCSLDLGAVSARPGRSLRVRCFGCGSRLQRWCHVRAARPMNGCGEPGAV